MIRIKIKRVPLVSVAGFGVDLNIAEENGVLKSH